MKNLEKILLIAVIVVPIVICSVVIKNIWSDDEDYSSVSGDNGIISITDGVIYISGDERLSGDNILAGVSGEIREMDGTQYVTTIGDPTSKIFTDASVQTAVANVYLESDESSEVVGKLEKHTKVIAQRFNQGWTRVSGKDATGINVSGWIRTENVSFGDNVGTILGTNEKIGTVTAEPYLNIRATASSSATILGKVDKGATVTIQETSNGWHKVTVNGVTGWVSADFVKTN